MSKILFSDLDGTLLCDDKSISSANRKAVFELIEQGHYFVICTGRPVASGRIVAKQLGFTSPGCYMVCFNGGILYDCASDRVLKEESLDMADVIHLFENAKKAEIHIQTYNDTDILTLAHTKELDYYRERSNMSYKIVPNLIDGLDKNPQKCLLCALDDKEKLERFQKENAIWTEQSMSSFFSCEEYLEYVPKGIDKGSGVRNLVSLLGIAPEDVYAIGDERNDIPMLQQAHIGIAMANSHREVFSFADYVTQNDNNHDGVAEGIYKFILDK